MRILLVCLALAFIAAGCQSGAIEDSFTKKKLQPVDKSGEMFTIRATNDFMLGVDDYHGKQLVVDPGYYANRKIARGDVVYFSIPKNSPDSELVAEDKQVLRVVGLSGEKIRMKKGQIIIDGKRLNAFYGVDMNNDIVELKRRLRTSDLAEYEIENIKNAIRYVENENMKEIRVPDGTIFLLGDNRSRAVDSVIAGPIPIANIIGKVIGVQ